MEAADEPQGCLAALFRLVGIDLSRMAKATETLPYRLRDDFLSAAEFSFYRVLSSAVGGYAVVCPKVNLADLFYATGSKGNRAHRNKIDRKHVDFLLCHPETMKPLCGVELDDGSHSRQATQDRDRLVEAVFDAAGLPLVRFPAKVGYSVSDLAARVLPALQAKPRTIPQPPPAPFAAPVAATPEGTAPTCPKCAVPMVRRTASKGANAGNRFWGCVNYPKCREMC